MSASEPEMEHYLRLAGWKQAALYPINWIDPTSPTGMTVHRLKQAVQLQIGRDQEHIKILQERLQIVL